MPEPIHNPNPKHMVDPPGWVRRIVTRILGPEIDPRVRQRRRDKFEKARQANHSPHVVEYFHQLDDPYSHLTAQILNRFCRSYDIKLKFHLVRAAGGMDQPQPERLAHWARTDAAAIAPHYGLIFPLDAPIVPSHTSFVEAGAAILKLSDEALIESISDISKNLWANTERAVSEESAELTRALDEGARRLKALGHYSGAMFYYGGEWYWGADRLLYLEARLRSLGAFNGQPDDPFIVPRPNIDVADLDAKDLNLEFFCSLNSPYTSIIYDRTMDLKNSCQIKFELKPVLPMIMRGVPASRNKGKYIFFDTKREADLLGVPFGPFVTPIGDPVRNVYSLMAWAKEQGKDEALLGSCLRHAFSLGIGLHRKRGLKKAVEAAGLSWMEAKNIMGNTDWRAQTKAYQDEMVDNMGLWGVPSYRLRGPAGEPDLTVWGQDRLWLVAREIRRRATI